MENKRLYVKQAVRGCTHSLICDNWMSKGHLYTFLKFLHPFSKPAQSLLGLLGFWSHS